MFSVQKANYIISTFGPGLLLRVACLQRVMIVIDHCDLEDNLFFCQQLPTSYVRHVAASCALSSGVRECEGNFPTGYYFRIRVLVVTSSQFSFLCAGN